MKRTIPPALVWSVAVIFAIACGRLPVGTGEVSPASSSDVSPTASPEATAVTPSPSPSFSPSPTQWPVYTDSTYHFSISYPNGFTVERDAGDGRTGLLVSYRAVDPVYLNSYPPGQLEFVVYTRDADTLTGWVAKHSGPSGSTDITRYWTPVTNQSVVTVASSAGLSFDWVPDMQDKTIHATILFAGTSYVLLIQWWSTDAAYAPTLKDDYSQMLLSVRV